MVKASNVLTRLEPQATGLCVCVCVWWVEGEGMVQCRQQAQDTQEPKSLSRISWPLEGRSIEFEMLSLRGRHKATVTFRTAL